MSAYKEVGHPPLRQNHHHLKTSSLVAFAVFREFLSAKLCCVIQNKHDKFICWNASCRGKWLERNYFHVVTNCGSVWIWTALLVVPSGIRVHCSVHCKVDFIQLHFWFLSRLRAFLSGSRWAIFCQSSPPHSGAQTYYVWYAWRKKYDKINKL